MLYTLKRAVQLPAVLALIATTSCSTPQEKISTPQEKMEVKEVKTFKAQVGEGPIWDYKNNRLLWIDPPGSV